MNALHHRLNGIAIAGLLVLCLFSATSAHTKVVDEELLDALEQAQERDQLDVARRLRERLKQGRPAPGTQKRLVELVGQSQNLIKYGFVDMLYYLNPGRELDEASIIAVASGLSSGAVHNAGSAEQLARLLIDYGEARPLPALAISHLHSAITRPRGMNAAYAIRVLQRMSTTDTRFARTVINVSAALEHEYNYVRLTAAKALAAYGAVAALPDEVLSTLVRSATTDAFMHVRIESFAALATQSQANRSALTASLTTELTTPTVEVWEASKGMSGYHELTSRAINLLMGWLEPPYPVAVVDALIAQTLHQHHTTLPYLESVAESQAFSNTQTDALKAYAHRIREEEPRQRLYAVIAGSEVRPSTDQLLTAFKDDRSLGAQLMAAYHLERTYQAQVVPTAVATITQQVLLDSKHPEVRTVAARLLASSNLAVPAKEQVLFAALRKHSGDASVADTWLGLYADDQVQDLARRYAGDGSLPPWTRSQLVDRLAKQAAPERHLQPATRSALIDAGAGTDSYVLNNAVVAALESWHESVPLSVRFANKQFLGSLLFGIYVTLAIAFIVGSLANLIAAISVPLRESVNATGTTAKRTGLVMLWLTITVVGLIVFAIAFIGFLGHNSTPDPRGSAKLNIPMYVVMFLFVLYTSKNIAWFRRRSRLAANPRH